MFRTETKIYINQTILRYVRQKGDVLPSWKVIEKSGLETHDGFEGSYPCLWPLVRLSLETVFDPPSMTSACRFSF